MAEKKPTPPIEDRVPAHCQAQSLPVSNTPLEDRKFTTKMSRKTTLGKITSDFDEIPKPTEKVRLVTLDEEEY